MTHNPYYRGNLQEDQKLLDVLGTVADTLDNIGRSIGYGRAQQVLQIQWAKYLHEERDLPMMGALLPEPERALGEEWVERLQEVADGGKRLTKQELTSLVDLFNMAAEISSKPKEPEEEEPSINEQWRDLALRFDSQRMLLRDHIRAMDKLRDNQEKINSLLDAAMEVINKAPDIKAAPHGPDVDCAWKVKCETIQQQLEAANKAIKRIEENNMKDFRDVQAARLEGRNKVLEAFSKYGDSNAGALYAELENKRDELSILRQRSDTVWVVSNSTSVVIFATHEDALAYVSSHPASVGGGMSINGTILIGNRAPLVEGAMLDAQRYRILRDLGVRLHHPILDMWYVLEGLDCAVDFIRLGHDQPVKDQGVKED